MPLQIPHSFSFRKRVLPGIALLLFGSSFSSFAQEPASKKTVLKNELVPLRIRSIERSDRQFLTESRGSILATETTTKEINWESERLSDQALLSLKKLAQGEGNEGEFDQLVADDFSGTSPLPKNLNKAESHVPNWELWQARSDQARFNRDSFKKELQHKSFANAHFKIIGVELTDTQLKTEVLVEFGDTQRQGNATWICHWQLLPKGPLKLQRLERKSHEELRGPTQPMFRDATTTVLGNTPHFSTQVQRGISDWADEISRFSDFALTGHHGIAVGDVDGDGLEDVFVCDGGGLPNRLYRQRADGSAEDISAKTGLDWYEDSRAALLIDLDNDGDQDLVVATIGVIAFAENDGTGTFTLKGGFPGAQYPFSMAAADYDLDGDLYIYVCLYGEGDNATGGRGFDSRSPIPFEDARNGGRNVLLNNLGNFAFSDVTDTVGLGKNNDRWSFSAAWEDYDRDGDSDLYVANDFGQNTLYRNDNGHFTEIANELGVEDTAAGMSVSWGDYNRDGHFDLYVGNMFSSAGERISNQDLFAPGRNETSLSGLQRMARGNSLFAGGASGFSEVPQAAGASMGRWAWSSGFVDLNNDSWEDLVITNGYLTGWEDKKDL